MAVKPLYKNRQHGAGSGSSNSSYKAVFSSSILGRPTMKSKKALLQKFVDDIKSSNRCAHCGYKAHKVALKFHNIDSQIKDYTISNAINKNFGLELYYALITILFYIMKNEINIDS